ncbi:MAG: UvrD-helicase domain-containing protein [Bacillota bacterium]|nr:UvrD-helicase domain-containing protein [Bacillota bacterium]
MSESLAFTPEQQRVIDEAPGSILVTAAAGSGKTTVMVERIVRRVLSGEASLSRSMIMTFTEAAAASMSRKIARRLDAALQAATTPADRQRLEEELLSLPFAQISTIHAACLRLVRQFGYLLEAERDGRGPVPAETRTSDAEESGRSFQAALDRLLTLASAALDKGPNTAPTAPADTAPTAAAAPAAAAALLDVLPEPELRQLLEDLYRQLRALPHYRRHLDNALRAAHQEAADFAAGPLAAWLIELLVERLDGLLALRETLHELLADPDALIYSPKTPANAAKNAAVTSGLQTLMDEAARLHQELTTAPPHWDDIVARAQSLSYPERSGRYRSPASTALRSFIREEMEPALAPLLPRAPSYRDPFDGIFTRSAAEIGAELETSLPLLDACSIVLGWLDDELIAGRQAAQTLDFADFEHLALALLEREEVQSWLGANIDEVLVDEYQDTSALQNEIIRRLAPDRNFAVGDIKQSIYRFRHAAPELFVRRMAQAADPAAPGTLLSLSVNFRSVPAVLTAVNKLFAAIMSRGSADIDYRDGHALVPHRQDLSVPPRRPVRLILLTGDDPAAGDDNDSDSADLADLHRFERQALWIAAELAARRRAGEDFAWRRIAVLCRSNSAVTQVAQVLINAGIPVAARQEGRFMGSWELGLLDQLLRLVNNRRQDLPLLACLRQTPVYGRFSDLELLEMRSAALTTGGISRREPYHSTVFWYCEAGPDDRLRSRLQQFFAWLDRLAAAAQEHSLLDVARLAIEDTGLESLLASSQGGARRLATLDRFLAWLAEWEPVHGRDLGRLADFLESERARQPEQNLFADSETAEDAVTVTTMHRSKGLEFPEVYLIGLDARLGRRSTAAVALHSRLGLGAVVAPPDQPLRWPSIALQIIREQEMREDFAEELRLLYVALTRAEDCLTLVASLPENPDYLATTAERAARLPAGPWPAPLVRAASSARDLILLELFRQNSAEALLRDGCLEAAHVRVELIREATLPSAPTVVSASATAALPATGAVPVTPLAAYAWPDATKTVLKYSVSELKRLETSYEEEGERASSDALLLPEARGQVLELSDWDLAEHDSAADRGRRRGTALHQALRFLPVAGLYHSSDTLAALRATLDELAAEGVLLPDERSLIAGREPDLAAFYQSPLAAEIAACELAGRPLYREIPFSYAWEAAKLFPDRRFPPHESILIQGMIDLYFTAEDGSLVLVDYKSDRVPPDPEKARALLLGRYRRQIELYSQAIELGTGMAPARCLIWSLPARRAFAVDLNERK